MSYWSPDRCSLRQTTQSQQAGRVMPFVEFFFVTFCVLTSIGYEQFESFNNDGGTGVVETFGTCIVPTLIAGPAFSGTRYSGML